MLNLAVVVFALMALIFGRHRMQKVVLSCSFLGMPLICAFAAG